MNDRTMIRVQMIMDTHPDRDYLNDEGQPHRCIGCDGLMFWTDLRGWSHHRNNPSCWMNSQEQQ